jgi:hypothetical protein
MQDIYKQRSNWKIILALTGILILLITILYSNYLANKLIEVEEKNAQLFQKAVTKINEGDTLNIDPSSKIEDMSFIHDVVMSYPFPVILESDYGSAQGQNFSPEQDTNQQFLIQKIKEHKASGKSPVIGPPGYASKIYFFNSKLVTYINYFPLVQILLVGFFIGLGYYLFNASKKAEQNRVWAGMAKETAHQLGTPISAIFGWIQHLRDNPNINSAQSELIDELEKDVQRLDLIADRFSKIGSAPELKKHYLVKELNEVKEYMKRRAPRKINFNFPNSDEHHEMVNINQHLFAWVVENLLRNSLDAMNNEGAITASVYSEGEYHCVDIKDTGKGIPQNKFKTVFQPGYSTKSRGWGLGLSLANRIIEEYHQGKIFVKNSVLGEGTTFTIKLPMYHP